FETHRPRLRSMAYRMLGSMPAAEDAVQDAWLRLSTVDSGAIQNIGGWLTTTVARECLHELRGRRTRREEELPERLPDPMVTRENHLDPEADALLAEVVGLALLVVLDTLTPAERLAFVLHDLFAFSFDEVAKVLDRSPDAVRQLASRARRRVADAHASESDTSPKKQREVVDAFFAAARTGDLAALLEILHPDVVLRADLSRGGITVIRGNDQVVKLAQSPEGAELLPVLVNGVAGALVTVHGEPFSLMALTVVDGRVASIEVIGEAERVARLVAHLL
ncbi:MAG: sigma-70 family RNA polymerase sigma factor, partial [Nocardioidaceae bacterium]